MPTGPTPRQQARTANLVRIRALALEQLASGGAAELSLRAIARELNIVSSAIYRYYPGRDELITDLVVEAYADLATKLEAAARPRRSPRARWLATCLAMRTWAVAAPHRFALVYGSAIPGYVAPPSTVEPAGRVVGCFFTAGLGRAAPTGPMPRALRTDLDRVGAAFGSPSAAEVLAVIGAFSQVVGLLTLELNGHFVGGFEPADALFETLVAREADALGL